MVSNAKEDLPEPESPVSTTSRSRGSFTLIFFKLCSLAPVTVMYFELISVYPFVSSFLKLDISTHAG